MTDDSVRAHNRFDIQVELLESDSESGRVEVRIRPDPGRYDWLVKRDGARVLYDRFDDVYFPHALVIDMLKRAMNMPHASALGVIPDIKSYAASRRPSIASALRGEDPTVDLVDLAEAKLREFEIDELAFVILSVDIVGSTSLQIGSDRKTFARTISMLLTEIAELVALFHGHVLKYTGDGLIAYFAEPTFIIKNDLAVDCACCVRRLIRDAVCPELVEAGLPTIDVRLGLDGGEATVQILGSTRTKRHADIIGEVVSLACKIESRAGTGEVFLGETVVRNLHFRWRELCTPVERPVDWTYSIDGHEPYPLFRLDPAGTRPVERAPQKN